MSLLIAIHFITLGGMEADVLIMVEDMSLYTNNNGDF
jgi:hypothetical protein